PMNLTEAYLQLSARLLSDPAKLWQTQFDLLNSYGQIWQSTAMKMWGMESKPVVEPGDGDRRFRHDDWSENPLFDFIKQSYLITSGAIQKLAADVDGLDEKTAHKIEFYTRQYVDALAPTNFAMLNPEVLRATVESNGQNLVDGVKNFLKDFDAETGQLRTRMTDTEAFELGKNVATSPGKVVFQNDMFQLIQYAPTTEKVFKKPLLIMPPWINKFYILDLQPKNSMIKWLVDQGHTVFVMSWVNPDESLGDKDFENYMLEGPITALDAVEQATGEKRINIIGYCIGGTLLGATLAYARAKNMDDCFASATFFTALMDFSDPGDLGVFVDDQQLASLEENMSERGYLDGGQMATTFNMLRANDLIWSFVINNYLLGKDPFPFDLLYWNSDSTRMPAKMHSTYLRKMYLENIFREPGGLTLDGVPIDIRTIQTPACFISTVDDHIAPWKSTYAGAQLLNGDVNFVLGKSGHIAGVVNPPASNKYGYFSGGSIKDVDPDTWLEGTTGHEGSWWPAWQDWVKQHAGKKVPARTPGDGKLKALEDAPGSYVKVRTA
ncbi:MAG: class I poly(R)-hydroxyalkanoic acid synthase, partial [Gammaproteobacteria bacterium]|nr:class I poly(R)-hydroxyalkanoic acid synthase [Gammaproteobacteria bacterium]